MKYLFRISAFALLAISLITGSAYATDGDIYRDSYSSEDSSGTWTYTGSGTHTYSAGNLALTTGSITMATGTLVSKAAMQVLTATSSTIGTVTAAKTGYTFVIDPADTVSPTGQYELLLPSATGGLVYKFAIATSRTVMIRPQTGDRIMYQSLGAGQAIVSPASTGSTITLQGQTGKWYVSDIDTPLNTGGWTMSV